MRTTVLPVCYSGSNNLTEGEHSGMKGRAIAGIALILLGAYLFFMRDENISTGSVFAYFWPTLFVIPVGILLHWLYFGVFGRNAVGVLVPAGIVTTAGIVCQIATLTDGWSYLWPGFILAVAVGLFELYWFSGRNKALLIPINILAGASLIFFVAFSIGNLIGKLALGQPFLAIVFILAGAFLLAARRSTP
jgi:hypothetical protein